MNKEKEEYPITISDWLGILRDECSIIHNLEIFLATIIIISIIGIPTLFNLFRLQVEYYSITFLLYIIVFWILYRFGQRMIKKAREPYEKLYKKIIKGDITDPLEIREEYFKIEGKKRKNLL